MSGSDKTKNKQGVERKMNEITITMKEYKELLAHEARHEADKLRLATVETDLEKANKKNELIGSNL